MPKLVLAALKLTAILVGFVGTLLSLMAVVGFVVDNFWVRLGVALVVAVVTPLLVANQLIPKEADQGLGEGVVSDTFAVVWLAVATLFIGALLPITRPLLEAEAARLTDDDARVFAAALYLSIGSPPAGPAGASAIDPAPATGTDPAPPPSTAAAAPADGGAQAKPDEGTGGAAASPPSPKPTPAPSGKRLTPAEIFKTYAASVVNVSVRGKRGAGSGTGFVIDSDGTIATNHHVIAGAEHVRVKLLDGAWIEDVELLTSDEKVDLALLKVNTQITLPVVHLGNSETITVGEQVVSIGNPLGLDHTLTDGLISARRVFMGRKLIQMSAPISPGNSGGPLFNENGEVIGISTATIGAFQAQALNLAVPVDILKGMLAPEYPNRKKFGGSGTW